MPVTKIGNKPTGPDLLGGKSLIRGILRFEVPPNIQQATVKTGTELREEVWVETYE